MTNPLCSKPGCKNHVTKGFTECYAHLQGQEMSRWLFRGVGGGRKVE